MSLFRALRAPPFAALWVAHAVSRIGDGIYTVALAWWVLENTGSAAVMGAVLVAEVAPSVAFLALGGVLVDRWPRLRLLLTTDVIRAVIVLGVAGLAQAGTLQVWHLILASVALGATNAIFYPAAFAAVPDLVEPQSLTSANSLVQISSRLAGIVSPGAGAAVVAILGIAPAFALDAASFLISAAAIAIGIVLSGDPSPTRSQARTFERMREGFQFVLNMPWLSVTIGVAALSTVTLAGPLEAALPFLVATHLGEGVEAFGLLGSLSALGAVMSGAVLGRRSRLRRRGLLLYGSWITAALLVAVMGLPVGFVATAIAMIGIGAALSILGLAWVNTLQELVPRELRGRVASIDQLGSSCLLPVGFALAGMATDRFGPALVFLGGGLLSALIIAAGLIHPRVRCMD